MGCIYCIINKLNDKLYIGKTVDFKTRKRAHIHAAKNGEDNSPIHKAMHKYGIENFKWSILKDNIPEDKLDENEIFYIAKFNTFHGKHYNCTSGGEGITGYRHTKATLELLTECGRKVAAKSRITIDQYTLQGVFVQTWGSITDASTYFRSEDTNIRDAVSGKQKTAYGFLWVKHGEMCKSYVAKSARAKEIIQYTLDGVFIRRWESASKAGNELNKNPSNINSACNHKNPSNMAFGFLWEFAGVPCKKYEKKLYYNSIIQQYSLDGRLVGEYSTLKEASESINVHITSISDAVHGRSKTSGGYRWTYKEGDN